MSAIKQLLMEEIITAKDQLLLRQLAQGNKRAFNQIFDRYKDRFYGAALKMTRSPQIAEEIVQEVFYTLWLKKAALSKVENPQSYLFSIVYHTISAHFRKLATEKAMKEKVIEKGTKQKNQTEESILEKDNQRWLQNILEHLPPQQQRVFKLSREEGLSRKEIAEKLAISPHTVKNHLLKATKFLQMHWEQAL